MRSSFLPFILNPVGACAVGLVQTVVRVGLADLAQISGIRTRTSHSFQHGFSDIGTRNRNTFSPVCISFSSPLTYSATEGWLEYTVTVVVDSVRSAYRFPAICTKGSSAQYAL